MGPHKGTQAYMDRRLIQNSITIYTIYIWFSLLVRSLLSPSHNLS